MIATAPGMMGIPTTHRRTLTPRPGSRLRTRPQLPRHRPERRHGLHQRRAGRKPTADFFRHLGVACSPPCVCERGDTLSAVRCGAVVDVLAGGVGGAVAWVGVSLYCCAPGFWAFRAACSFVAASFCDRHMISLEQQPVNSYRSQTIVLARVNVRRGRGVVSS